MSLIGHCDDCSFLGGCYFLENKMPTNPVLDDKGLMHPNCHCEKKSINKSIPNTTVFAIYPTAKWNDYAFNETKSNGKTAWFNNHRYSKADSPYLINEYEKQAVEKYAKGDYQLYKLNLHGYGITIIIDLNGNKIKTGWKVRPKGKIVCTTIFSGEI